MVGIANSIECPNCHKIIAVYLVECPYCKKDMLNDEDKEEEQNESKS